MKPAIDYYEIFDGLLKRGAQVDLIDRTSVMGSRDPRVRLALRTAEPSAAVALAAFLRCTPAGFHEGALAGITALLEGMAMGKPVISTATVGMHPGIIRDGESGLLVPADDDHDALSRAIKRLWEDRNLRVRMGLNARR